MHARRFLHKIGRTHLRQPVFDQCHENKIPCSRRFLSQPSGGEGGKDRHAFFQQQLMELEEERKSFYPQGTEEIESTPSQATSSSSSHENSAFTDQMKEWKEEQRQVFGKELDDEELTGGSTLSNDNNIPPEIAMEEQAEYEDILEDQKQERDLLYNFSSHERSAWGSVPEKQSMQQLLEEVARERKRMEDGSSADQEEETVAFSQSESSTSSSDSIHHESFSHVSEDGNSIHMVDVGSKNITRRMAHAQTKVILPQNVLSAFGLDDSGTTELVGPKGPIFATAKIAGIMAAKNTSNLIPLCHPLPLDQVKIDIQMDKEAASNQGVVTIDCTCHVTHKTGVEMEALTGASVAALTIYDMTKAVSHEICITETKLIAKTGGKRIVQDGVNER